MNTLGNWLIENQPYY